MRCVRSVGFLLLLCLGAVLVPLGATAPASAQPPVATASGSPDARLELVLDSSGSMAHRMPDGGTRIAAAKQAVKDLVRRLPDDAQVGLRVFGATVFSRRDRGACSDTQSVVPVGPLDRAAISRAVARYRPYGETPIGAALKAAADDLGAQGRRTIVLLSDGEPTCAPDPCRVARQLHRHGAHLTIDVLGLDVSAAARRALRCVADAGGGSYYDVDDPAGLSSAMVSAGVRSLRTFHVEGTPVEGGATAHEAVLLSPGHYTDRLTTPEKAAFYRVSKPPGWGLRVGASTRPPTAQTPLEELQLTLSAPGGTTCGTETARRSNMLAARSIVSAGISFVPGVGRLDDEAAQTCARADELLLEVSYPKGVEPLLGLVIDEQPPVVAVGSLPEPVDDPDAWARRAHVDADPVTIVGGSDFQDAPELSDGVYRDTVRPGEQLLYRVPVGWGQAVRVTMTLLRDDYIEDVVGVVGDPVQVAGFNPARQRIQSLTFGGRVHDYAAYNGDGPTSVTFATAPVRLRNLSGYSALDDQALAGDYTVSLELAPMAQATRFAAPVRIEVEHVGQPQPGPEFASAPVAPPADDADGTAGGHAETGTGTGTGAGAGAGDADATARAEVAGGDHQDQGARDGLPLWLVAALGLVAVAGGVLTGGLVARRRRGR
jgi:Ca-activated chloride channel family protein